VAKVSGEVEGTYVEAEAKGNSSTGNVFSEDGAGQYHYNLDTKALSTGTWAVKITLDDGTSRTVRISLR
jgi:VCBS repeat-containing protein